MKVDQEEQTFQKITITLESLEELRSFRIMCENIRWNANLPSSVRVLAATLRNILTTTKYPS